jgi:hypothetical protein
MIRRWLPAVVTLALISLVSACGPKGADLGPSPDPLGGSPPTSQAERQRLAKAHAERQRQEERCLRERPALEARMAALRRAERHLAEVKWETYVPSPAPTAWNEASESRFRLEDREADWQRYLQEEEAWQRREESRRALWIADQRARLREAQARLDRQALALRSQREDLFTGPGSIEFNPEVAKEIRQCRKAGSQPMGKTAPAGKGPVDSKSVTVSSHSDTTP